MDRLRSYWPKKSTVVRLVRVWGGPTLLALILLVIVIMINHKRNNDDFKSYVKQSKLKASVESVNGYQQVYYKYKGDKVFVTSGDVSHTQPIGSGEYIVWSELVNGSGQIALYNVLTRTTLHVTKTGNNTSPAMYADQVVWEKYLVDGPQVYYFDGKNSQQISKGNPSARPAIKEGEIAYAQQISPKQWSVIIRDTANNEDHSFLADESLAWPHYIKGELKTNLDDTVLQRYRY